MSTYNPPKIEIFQFQTKHFFLTSFDELILIKYSDDSFNLSLSSLVVRRSLLMQWLSSKIKYQAQTIVLYLVSCLSERNNSLFLSLYFPRSSPLPIVFLYNLIISSFSSHTRFISFALFYLGLVSPSSKSIFVFVFSSPRVNANRQTKVNRNL